MNLRVVTENRIFKLLKATITDFMEDGALRLSAALAYYSIFSIAPLLVIAISIAGLVLGQEAVSGELGSQLKSYVGEQAAGNLAALLQRTRREFARSVG